MTNFAWWQEEANKQGLVMCCLCFESKNPSLMHKLEDGYIEDVCQECWDLEQAELERRRRENLEAD